MFGLHPELWMGGDHCLNGDWIIWLMVVGSSVTTVLYLVFCVLAFLMWRIKPNWLSDNTLFLSLSIVFFLCGSIHFGHGVGKIIPEFYLTSLLYPLLVVVMGKTLYDTLIVLGTTKGFVERETVDYMQEKLNRFEKLLDDNGINYNTDRRNAGEQCVNCTDNSMVQ